MQARSKPVAFQYGIAEWHQAIPPITLSLLVSGTVAIAVAGHAWVRVAQVDLRPSVAAIGVGAFAVGVPCARALRSLCRFNEPLTSSPMLQMVVGVLGLLLLGILARDRGGASVWLASFWVGVGALAIATACLLPAGVESTPSQSAQNIAQNPEGSTLDGEAGDRLDRNLERLSVIPWGDRTLRVEPSPALQQPRQVHGLICLAAGLCIWTLQALADVSGSIAPLLAGLLVFVGLTSIGTWRLHLDPARRRCCLHYCGPWEWESRYTLAMADFSRLQAIQLQDAELTWLQLSGVRYELVLPPALIGLGSDTSQESDLERAFLSSFRLARHSSSCDSLGLMGILLPQGAGILAGTAVLLMGGALCTLFAVTPAPLWQSTVSLLGIAAISPTLARQILLAIAPSNLRADRVSPPLRGWEIGIAAIAMAWLPEGSLALREFVGLALGWLALAVGVAMLALVRRSPLRLWVE